MQICQLHQIKQVTKHLTRRPQTEAGRELRALVLTLTKADEKTFTDSLIAWHTKRFRKNRRKSSPPTMDYGKTAVTKLFHNY